MCSAANSRRSKTRRPEFRDNYFELFDVCNRWPTVKERLPYAGETTVHNIIYLQRIRIVCEINTTFRLYLSL